MDHVNDALNYLTGGSGLPNRPDFNLWTVENPMTVMVSPANGKWHTLESAYHECYVYNAWYYKTMNLNTIKITLSLN